MTPPSKPHAGLRLAESPGPLLRLDSQLRLVLVLGPQVCRVELRLVPRALDLTVGRLVGWLAQ